MITNTIQAALTQPEMSCRRKMSAKIVIRSQNQITHRKKMNIVQSKSKNG